MSVGQRMTPEAEALAEAMQTIETCRKAILTLVRPGEEMSLVVRNLVAMCEAAEAKGRDALAESDAAPRLRVKPLVWDVWGGGEWRSEELPGGEIYQVERARGGWVASQNGFSLVALGLPDPRFPTREAAQVAAQAHHEVEALKLAKRLFEAGGDQS